MESYVNFKNVSLMVFVIISADNRFSGGYACNGIKEKWLLENKYG